MVIFDEKIKKAFFIRDRFAEKPLYYKLDNNIFYFTSEIKALSSLLSLKEDIENLNININCSKGVKKESSVNGSLISPVKILFTGLLLFISIISNNKGDLLY